MGKTSNFKKFLLLWAGEFISSVGGGLTSFGLGVYVYAQTGSAGSQSLVTLLAFLPMLILSVLSRKCAKRRLYLATARQCSKTVVSPC